MKSPSVEDFSDNVSEVISHISSEKFPIHFQGFLKSLITFSNFFLLRFVKRQVPDEIYSWIPEDTLSAFYKNNYFKFGYQLDPYFQLANRQFTNGAYPLKQIAPDRFFTSEYYKTYYTDAKMGDEIGILMKVSNDIVIHLSLGRLKFEPKFSKHEFNRIKQHDSLICTLLKLHYQLHLSKTVHIQSGNSVLPLEQRLKSWCTTDRQCDLTKREAQIAALILQGHSSISAALTLNIATETVKVHRKNLYRKLKVGTQAELFSLLSRLIN